MPGEVATATICGMGGPLEGLERLVLQPMAGEERLWEWLATNNRHLVSQQIVEDAARIYVILVAEPGAVALSKTDLLAR